MLIPWVSAMPWIAIGVSAISASKFSPLTARMQQLIRNTNKMKINIFLNLKTSVNTITFRKMVKLSSIHKKYFHIYYVPKMYLEYMFFNTKRLQIKQYFIALILLLKDWTIFHLWINTFVTLRVNYHFCHHNYL